MKRFYYQILFLLSVNFTTAQELCEQRFATDYINSNKLNAWVNATGDLFTNPDGYTGLQIFNPEDSLTINTFFQAGLVMGALDDMEEERVAWRTYYYDGADSDYSPGHLVGELPDTLRCNRWNKIWRVSSADIYLHLAEIASNGSPLIRRPAIYNYPAMGNPYFIDYNDFPLPENVALAPFYDANNDALYNPDDGDYPLPENVHPTAYPDLLLWSVYNTTAPFWRNVSLGKRLALEIQQTAFAYQCEQSELLDKTMFTQHRVINRSKQTWDSLFIGNRFDGDIGNFADDCLGTAVDLNTFYSYNCDEKDGEPHESMINAIPNGNLPVQAITFLNHSLDQTRAFWNSGITIYSFQYQESSQADRLYHSLNGNWADDMPLTYGGFGYQTEGGESTNFIFPDPPYENEGWSMPGNHPPSADLRGLMTHYVGDFISGAAFQLDQAWSYHRGQGGDHFSNIRLMYEQIPRLQQYYDNGFANLNCNQTTAVTNTNNTDVVELFPNPTTSILNIKIPNSTLQKAVIYNPNGQLIKQYTTTEMNLRSLPTGIYFLKIITTEGIIFTKKVVKL